MGAFYSGELDPIYLAKMATDQTKERTREQRVNCTTDKLIPESLSTKPKISEPITVVWQQCDHSCNTRAKSLCSPENVGEQGYVVDHGFLMIRENNIPFQICVNPVQRSEATKKEQRPLQDQ